MRKIFELISTVALLQGKTFVVEHLKSAMISYNPCYLFFYKWSQDFGSNLAMCKWREDIANIMLGMALFNQKKLSLARKAFEAALPDKRSKRTAQQWIAYVDSELRRQALMDQELPDMAPRKIDQILQLNQ